MRGNKSHPDFQRLDADGKKKRLSYFPTSMKRFGRNDSFGDKRYIQ